MNYLSTRLLQRSKINSFEYKNQIFPNNSHIHLRACDAASSYHCTYPITGSNIPKWDCILNCCSDCTRMNAPHLESSEKIDLLFTASLHKIRFHLFQNISKRPINGLRQFKHKQICELCDNIQDKDKRGIITANKCFFPHEEVIGVFHDFLNIPTIENCHFS